MNNKNILLILVLLTVVGAGSFFVGTKFQQSRSPRLLGNFRDQRSGQFLGRGQGFRPVNGEIISLDDQSLTVKLMDNSSKIVLFTPATAINKSAAGSKEDLKVGEKIAAFGTENQDGSITAQTIQLNPVLRSSGVK